MELRNSASSLEGRQAIDPNVSLQFHGGLHLTGVLSRISLNLKLLLDEPASNSLYGAMAICSTCRFKDKCDQWISQNEEGAANNPPTFCPAMYHLGCDTPQGRFRRGINARDTV